MRFFSTRMILVAAAVGIAIFTKIACDATLRAN